MDARMQPPLHHQAPSCPSRSLPYSTDLRAMQGCEWTGVPAGLLRRSESLSARISSEPCSTKEYSHTTHAQPVPSGDPPAIYHRRLKYLCAVLCLFVP